MSSREVMIPWIRYPEDIIRARAVCREINAHLRGGDQRYAYALQAGEQRRIVGVKIRHTDSAKWGEHYDPMGKRTDGTWFALTPPVRVTLSNC